MKQRQFWFRATWGACFVALFLPSLIPVSSANARLFALTGVLLFFFGIVQAIRNLLYKAERLKAIARGECPSCGCELLGQSGTACPSCGEIAEAEHE